MALLSPPSVNQPNDLLGGTAEIRVEQNGKMVPLSSLINVGNSVTFVEQVRVKIALFNIVQIEVTLNPTIEDALALIKSGTLGIGFSLKTSKFKTSTSLSADALAVVHGTEIDMNKIAVRLHYGSLVSNWFKGLLLQPEIEISSEGISITLKAIGMLFASVKQGAPITFEKGTLIINAVKTLLDESQVNIKFDPFAQNALNVPFPSGRSFSTNHMDAAKTLLQEKNCKFVMTGSIGEGGKQNVRVFHVKESRQKYIAEFSAFRQIDPTKRQFPMITFSSPIQNVMFGSFAGHNIGAGKKGNFNPIPTKDSYKQRGTVISIGDKSTAGDVSKAKTTATGDAGGVPDPKKAPSMIPVVTSAIDLIKGYVHDFVDKVFEYDITSVGVVDLLPGNLIKVSIADVDQLSGVFDLVEVEHVVNTSGVETSLHMVRTGGLITIASQGVQQAEVKAQVAFGKSKKSITNTINQTIGNQ